jgi:hypothetical protein
MALQWYAIDPQRTDKGSFTAFAHRPNADDLRPVNLDPDDQEFQVIDVLETFLGWNQATELGVGPFGGFQSTASSVVLTYDLMAYTEKTIAQPIAGEIYGTRWGAGVRLAVAVGEAKADADLSIGMVAAKTELGMARSSFRLTVYGVNDLELLKLVPGPGAFDIKSYTQILDATTAIKNYMGDPSKRTSLHSQPIQVCMLRKQQSTLMDDAQSAVFALRRIARGKTLKQARDESLTKGFSADVIAVTYEHILKVVDETVEPDRDQRAEASRWLDV